MARSAIRWAMAAVPRRVVAVVLGAALLACRPPSVQATLVLTGGTVYPVDGSGRTQAAIALLGPRVLSVGSTTAVARFVGPNTRVIGLNGATVVPGLVDAHLHIENIGKYLRRLDLRGRSLPELMAAVAEAHRTLPAGRPILGRGWDQNLWQPSDCPSDIPCLGVEGFPDHALLDRAAPGRDVLLTRVDGHAVWASGPLLDRARIADHEDPQGGRIVRRRRRPAGVLIDNAIGLVEAVMPTPSDTEVREAIELAQDHLLARGLTAAHDMSVSPAARRALQAMDKEGKLRLRVFAYLWGNEDELASELQAVRRKRQGRRLTIQGVKLMADGALGSRGAALLAPYRDANHVGALLLSPEALEAKVREIETAGLQVTTHAIGDRANRTVLDVYERVLGARAAERRPRIEHVQVIEESDLGRLVRMGVVASIQPTHATSDMPWAEARLGDRAQPRAYVWQSLRTAGATLAAGSDAPVESADPRWGLYAARTRMDHSGQPRGGWFAEQRLGGQAALRAFTWGAAYAVGMESKLGSLRPGHIADLSVLGGDPVRDDPNKLLAMPVRATIVAGEVLYEAAAR